MNEQVPIIETPMEAPPVTPTSEEDKFFGMNSVMDTGDIEDNPTKIEVVDDRPPEDQKPPAKQVEKSDDDEELKGYSENVQKRINKLTFEKNEERRGREAALKMRDEAIHFTRIMTNRAQQYENIIHTGEANLVEQIKGRAAHAVDLAKSKYAKAYEEGDSKTIIEAQQEMINAQAEAREALNYEQDYQYRSQQFVEGQQQQAYQQRAAQQAAYQAAQTPQVPEPTERAETWAKNNKWFFEKDRPDMVALAYGIHERLIRGEGMEPDSEAYFTKLDSEMHEHFPKYFDANKGTSQSASPAPTVVASADRNNGAKPRIIKLSRTEVAIAKKLGLTNEQYAHEKFKDMF